MFFCVVVLQVTVLQMLRTLLNDDDMCVHVTSWLVNTIQNGHSGRHAYWVCSSDVVRTRLLFYM